MVPGGDPTRLPSDPRPTARALLPQGRPEIHPEELPRAFLPRSTRALWYWVAWLLWLLSPAGGLHRWGLRMLGLAIAALMALVPLWIVLGVVDQIVHLVAGIIATLATGFVGTIALCIVLVIVMRLLHR